MPTRLRLIMKVFGTDYDGVIINIEPQKAKIFGSILNRYWKVDEKEAEIFWHATGGTSRRSKFDYFYYKRFSKQLAKIEYEKIESEFSLLLKEKLYHNMSLLPDALVLLKFARSNFDYTFISSGMPMEQIKFLAKINNVSEYFDLILGTNNEFTSKTEHFKKITSQWKPDKIIFVADSAEDMRVAKNASAIPLGVLTNHTEQELKEAGASATCNLQDAISTIKNFT
jgi:phosphoglycolate phosphatase-like HAD superfamily hydrolase